MRCDDVTERLAFVKHVVPGERKVARVVFRAILEREVCDHPRPELKPGDVGRWVFFVRTNQIAGDELRRREDHVTSAVTARCSAVVIERRDLDLIGKRIYIKGGAVELDVLLRALVKMIHEAAVAFGPRDERLRFDAGLQHARAEIKDSGPRASLA